MSTTATTTQTADPHTDSAPPADDAHGSPVARLRRFATAGRIASAIELLAVVPALLTLWEVAKAPRLQFTDYWYVLLRITNGDGSLNLPGFRILQNEHPVMLPSLLYWLDARLADGDNRVLGVVVVVIAAVTVLLLRAALPVSLPPLVRASIVVAGSALVFSLHGLHNYVRAMSGSAWLTANLLVIIALLLAVRRRWWIAWAVGVLACMSYGTAFAVWPVLAGLATAQRERWWRRLLPLAVGAAIVLTWMLLKPAVDPGGQPASDPGALLYTFLTVVGHVWTASDSGVALLAGMVVLAGYAVLLTSPAARVGELWFWWALAGYAVLASAMIATARIDFGTEFGLSSRYTSLSVLASLPAGVLLATVLYRRIGRHRDVGPHTLKIAIVVLAAGVVGYTLGAPTATTIRSQLSEHPLQGVALRAGLGDAFGATLPPASHLQPRLQSMGHYPFSDNFTLGCGGPELGSVLNPDAMTPLQPADGRNPRRPAGSVDKIISKNGGANVVAGWATGYDDPVRCAVLMDEAGIVSGGGLSGLARPDVAAALSGISPNVGFSLIGPADPNSRVVVIFESGTMRWLPAKSPEVQQ